MDERHKRQIIVAFIIPGFIGMLLLFLVLFDANFFMVF